MPWSTPGLRDVRMMTRDYVAGALATVVLTFAKAHAIGISVLTSVGNESMIKTVDVIDYFVEDPATKVIALFLEEIGDPVRFAQAAARADAAGKPLVALCARLVAGCDRLSG